MRDSFDIELPVQDIILSFFIKFTFDFLLTNSKVEFITVINRRVNSFLKLGGSSIAAYRGCTAAASILTKSGGAIAPLLFTPLDLCVSAQGC